MKRFRKSSRKSSRKSLRKSSRKSSRMKNKTMKGGFEIIENKELVFSEKEQELANKINTEFKDKLAWFKINKFMESLSPEDNQKILSNRYVYDSLVSKFSDSSLYS